MIFLSSCKDVFLRFKYQTIECQENSFDLRKITVSNTKYSRDFKLSFIPVINIETELEELILKDFKCMGINGDAYIKSRIFKERLIGELSCTDDSYKIILFDRKYNQLGLITTDFNYIYLIH